MEKLGRRSFFRKGVLGLGTLGAFSHTHSGNPHRAEGIAFPSKSSGPRPFKLGLVTYNLAKDWDIETIIQNCTATGFEAVELRTTHKHGVEISISNARRADVKRRFRDSPIRLLSLGTTCEFHSPDPNVVEENIAETHRWCQLAQDLGCLGVKVRPNGFPPGVPEGKTLEQIGRALSKCGDFARDYGVEIWLEVHGEGTQLPRNTRHIMEISNHPAVGVCWNSNDTDVVSGSVKESYEQLKPWLRNCHIHELWQTVPSWRKSAAPKSETVKAGSSNAPNPYPWRELFSLLRSAKYDRYTLAEIPQSCEPIRLMHYYQVLWEFEAA